MMTPEKTAEKGKAIYELLIAEVKDDNKINRTLIKFITDYENGDNAKSSGFYVVEIAQVILKHFNGKNKTTETLAKEIEKVMGATPYSERHSKCVKKRSDRNEDYVFNPTDEDSDFTNTIDDKIRSDSSSKPSLFDEDFKESDPEIDENNPDNMVEDGCDEESDAEIDENNPDNMVEDDYDEESDAEIDENNPDNLVEDSYDEESDDDLNEKYHKFFETLPIPIVHRMILLARFGNQETSDEIASSFHMPKAVVDEIIRIASEQLRNNLELREQYLKIGKAKRGRR